MPKYIITKGDPLKGKIRINGAKNSALPIIAAALLGEGISTIDDIPYLNDVKNMCDLIKFFGSKVDILNRNTKLVVDPTTITSSIAPYDIVSKMRASFLILGPMVTKIGYAKAPLPGGCAIGTRPVDLHLKGFAAMGAEVIQDYGYVEIKINSKLKGTKIYLDFPSVGATENIMMAATMAQGQTIIENAAIEPEIVDLANFLTVMGADIKGAGTDTIKINGVESLKGCQYSVIPDRIEAGTYMVAAAITGGEVTIENVVPDHLKPVTAKLRETGVEIIEKLTSIKVSAKDTIQAIDIKTLPYPGFPTDMQAQMTSLMSKANGTSMISETIFENRFMHVSELKRMGANIRIEGRSAIVEGSSRLTGANVKAPDLRAGAALVIAGLVAEGITEIEDIHHIERGYCNMHGKLKSLGANITRVD